MSNFQGRGTLTLNGLLIGTGDIRIKVPDYQCHTGSRGRFDAVSCELEAQFNARDFDNLVNFFKGANVPRERKKKVMRPRTCSNIMNIKKRRKKA